MKKYLIFIVSIFLFLFVSCSSIHQQQYTREENKIYFGRYPQTRITDEDLISKLNDKAGEQPTSNNSYNWTDYNYYIEGNITSYMYYQDIDYDNDGTLDYRGVYYFYYRPFFYMVTSEKEHTYQDDNGYPVLKTYWFSYDPIEWNVLNEEDGKALIIANLLLDSQDYCPTSTISEFDHNGGFGYISNYELSDIRKWLNETFYNTAFTDLQKEIIKTTKVDNGVASTGQQENSYTCSDTKDKMFLLSYEEAVTYYTTNVERQAKGTDYAKAQGLYVSTFEPGVGYSYWWLRSPHYRDRNCVYTVDANGDVVEYPTYYNQNGIRPACWINLK